MNNGAFRPDYINFTLFLVANNVNRFFHGFTGMEVAVGSDKIYTMHNKFSNSLCFATFCAHLCAVPINFNCNEENRILGK